jgi:glycosyltransferase involved in cell wall biosynthesis
MSSENTITIATSIAPGNLRVQIEAIKSWEKLGLHFISVNAAAEIEILKHHFTTVNFVEAPRDASAIAGKPFIYLDDVLATLEKADSRVCGIVNSDIFLSADGDFLKFIVDQSRKAFIFGSRIDVDSLGHLDGDKYFGGFDFFFFDKAIIKLYQPTDFCLGLPWWDYWLPLVPMIKGMPVRKLITPFAYHVKHQQNWQQQFFETFGRRVAEYLKQQDRSHNVEGELKACLSYIDEPEIINFCKCILRYLKKVPEHIFYGEALLSDPEAIKDDVYDSPTNNRPFECEKTAMSEGNTVYASSGRTLKIAFFTSHPANVGSGSERLIYQTANALIERGHDARVYVMNAPLDKEPPFFVHQIPKVPMERLFERGQARLTGWNDLFFPSTPLLRLRQWLRSADIWHFHNLHGHYVSIPMLSLLSWTKHIIISPVDQYLSTGHCPYPVDCDRYLSGCGSCKKLHEPWPGISRDSTNTLWKIKRLSISSSKFNILFHTQALAGHYEKTFVSCRPGKVIHYGIDIHCFRPLRREECLRRLGLEPTSRFVVGLFHSYVLDPRKGILPLVHRLGELAGQFPGRIELLVVGHSGHAVKDIVPPELSVTVLPYLRHSHELANALNICDVLLYPTQSENLSLTCLNALACGVPVISYDAGGQKEAITNGYNGFIVDINDEGGMIGHLVDMIKNPVLCQQLSAGARATVEKDFDFDRYIDDLIAYYTGIGR